MRVALAQASWLRERSSLQLGESVVVVAESGTTGSEVSAVEQQQQEQQQAPRPMTVTTLSTAPGIFLAQDFLPVSVCDDIVALVADLAAEESGHRGANVYTVSYVCGCVGRESCVGAYGRGASPLCTCLLYSKYMLAHSAPLRQLARQSAALLELDFDQVRSCRANTNTNTRKPAMQRSCRSYSV